ncbi:CLN3 protein [Oesophagostomum dentatum]|uniref:Battenin n=1 Tax=Oesophagostomum dentatum TaxID=61180 RepID=A0A0B1SIA4_OESDE|nr:CLN3 protein [Oesophagostomum dentatum]
MPFSKITFFFQLELLEFDCSHGFNLGPESQYRWYQVLYQIGVFISRSSSDVITLPGKVLPLLAMLQMVNATALYLQALNRYVSHIFFMMCIIVYEGLLGGAAYVNTYRVVHNEIPPERKEFSMGFVSISDTFGILLAGFAAIPAHNTICKQPL